MLPPAKGRSAMDFTTLFGGWCNGPGLGHGGGAWMGGFGLPLGGIIQILLIGLVIYFVARAFREPVTNTGAPSPRDVLKRRYAAGEIDKETFDRMKDELK